MEAPFVTSSICLYDLHDGQYFRDLYSQNTADELLDADQSSEVALLEDCSDEMAGRGLVIWLQATLPSLGSLPALKSLYVGSKGT